MVAQRLREQSPVRACDRAENGDRPVALDRRAHGRHAGTPLRSGQASVFDVLATIISIEPGMMYARSAHATPAAGQSVKRHRKVSVTDLANHTHGDAAFADYTIIAGLWRTF